MRKAIAVLAIALCASCASAQSVATSEIPNTVILRLWLNMNTANNKVRIPTDVQLSAADQTALAGIMTTYQQNLAALATPYNAAVAAGGSYDRTGFWNSVNALVATTLTNIQLTLSPAGATQFMAYLASKKQGASVSPLDPGLGAATVARNEKESRMTASMHHMAAGQGNDGMTPVYSGLVSTTAINAAATDTFHRANGAPGSPWTNASGTFEISGNALEAATEGTDGAWMYYNTTVPITDGCVTTTLAAVPAHNYSGGVILRFQPGAETFYQAAWGNNGTTTYIVLQDAVNGTYNEFGGTYAYTAAVGDSLMLCAFESNISVFLVTSTGTTSQIISKTNSDITSAGYYGVIAGGIGTGQAVLSSFVGQEHAGVIIDTEVEGDTTCTGGSCPALSMHHAAITNSGGGYGGSSNSTPVTPPTYIQYEYNVTYPQTALDGTGGAGIPIDLSVQIICSIVGPFFTFEPTGSGPWTYDLWDQAEAPVTTQSKNTSSIESPQPWAIATNCYTEYTPPDLAGSGSWTVGTGGILNNFPYFGVWQPGFVLIGGCDRTGIGNWLISPWLCVGDIAAGQDPLPPAGFCNRWDAGTPGPQIINTGGPQP
jgi:hypothetical protein